METWDDGQHIPVCDGYIECCYADLAAGCRWMGDWDGWWGISRIVVDDWVCWHLDVYDSVMEGLDGEPGGIDGIAREWLDPVKVRRRQGG